MAIKNNSSNKIKDAIKKGIKVLSKEELINLLQ
jgi:hypothetical protein